jgi:hypothetical protein
VAEQAVEIRIVNVMSDLRNLAVNPHQLILLLGYYAPYDGGGGYFRWDATNASNDNGGTVIRSTAHPDAEAGRWQRSSPEAMTTANGSTSRAEPRLFEYNVRQFGAGSGDVTGCTDTCAIQAAIDSVPAVASARILVPPGTYYISNLHIDKEIIFEGLSGGGSGHTDVVLYVVRGHGLIVDSQVGIVDDFTRWLDEGALPACAPCTKTAKANTPGNGSGSIIRNLYIATSPTVTTDETLDGIRVYAACKIVDVFIERMGGNGITIGSDFFAPARGLTYASGWYLARILVVRCRGHGLSVSGGNAGAGLCLQFSSSQNGGHGFHDASTVANTYVSARSEDDVDGFHATDPNAPHTFVGCYMEGKGATTFDGGSSLIVDGEARWTGVGGYPPSEPQVPHARGFTTRKIRRTSRHADVRRIRPSFADRGTNAGPAGRTGGLQPARDHGRGDADRDPRSGRRAELDPRVAQDQGRLRDQCDVCGDRNQGRAVQDR